MSLMINGLHENHECGDGKKGELKNGGYSHDVIENTCRPGRSRMNFGNMGGTEPGNPIGSGSPSSALGNEHTGTTSERPVFKLLLC